MIKRSHYFKHGQNQSGPVDKCSDLYPKSLPEWHSTYVYRVIPAYIAFGLAGNLTILVIFWLFKLRPQSFVNSYFPTYKTNTRRPGRDPFLCNAPVSAHTRSPLVCECNFRSPTYLFIQALAYLNIIALGLSATMFHAGTPFHFFNVPVNNDLSLMRYLLYVEIFRRASYLSTFYFMAFVTIDRYLSLCRPYFYKAKLTNPNLRLEKLFRAAPFGITGLVIVVNVIDNTHWRVILPCVVDKGVVNLNANPDVYYYFAMKFRSHHWIYVVFAITFYFLLPGLVIGALGLKISTTLMKFYASKFNLMSQRLWTSNRSGISFLASQHSSAGFDCLGIPSHVMRSYVPFVLTSAFYVGTIVPMAIFLVVQTFDRDPSVLVDRTTLMKSLHLRTFGQSVYLSGNAYILLMFDKNFHRVLIRQKEALNCLFVNPRSGMGSATNHLNTDVNFT